MRMQYEILNVPVSQLAEASGISEDLIVDEIHSAGWKQYWPGEPSLANSKSISDFINRPSPFAITNVPANRALDEVDDLVDDAFLSTTAEIIEKSRRRLQVYTLAKETLLASKYLELENSILTAAIIMAKDIVNSPTGKYDPMSVNSLAKTYKEITAGSSLTSSGSIKIGSDENGMPTLIYKDLSGRM